MSFPRALELLLRWSHMFFDTNSDWGSIDRNGIIRSGMVSGCGWSSWGELWLLVFIWFVNTSLYERESRKAGFSLTFGCLWELGIGFE